MDKKKIFEILRAEIKKNLELAQQAAQNTYEAATHEDAKAENKYDTRGLEASYLAGAQAERVNDLRETLNIVSSIPIKDFSNQDKIALTALVELSSQDKESLVLLLPRGGGQGISFEGRTIQVITPASPLGKAILGRESGDVVEVNYKPFEIIEVW